MMIKTIAIIDDEKGIRDVLGDIFRDEGYRVVTASDGVGGISLVGREAPDLVFLDVRLPSMGGVEALERLRVAAPDLPVIIISGHATVDVAVRAIKMGAFDFLEKPIDMDKALTLCRNALAMNDLNLENRLLKRKLDARSEIIGSSPTIARAKELAVQAAKSDAGCLITGENGVGKELIAQLIHDSGKRNRGPFITVNCAAIPEDLIESELFGHEKGAFTGAESMRKGKFELASGGTLFLDEVGDLSLHAQAKLLRACQDFSFHRVGGEKIVKSDTRIVAATNKNLQEAVRDGQFREDLYFRLNVIPIEVPPLRSRGEDIPVLLDYFIERYDESSPPRKFSAEAISALRERPWPGNIRELKNFCQRLSILSEAPVFTLEVATEFMENFSVRKEKSQDVPVVDDSRFSLKLTTAKEQFEKSFLEAALKRRKFHLTKTAEDLGIYTSNLHAKIKRYGIVVKK